VSLAASDRARIDEAVHPRDARGTTVSAQLDDLVLDLPDRLLLVTGAVDHLVAHKPLGEAPTAVIRLADGTRDRAAGALARIAEAIHGGHGGRAARGPRGRGTGGSRGSGAATVDLHAVVIKISKAAAYRGE